MSHFPSKCAFCSAVLSFHKDKDTGEKVIDKPCECQASKEYLAAMKKTRTIKVKEETQ